MCLFGVRYEPQTLPYPCPHKAHIHKSGEQPISMNLRVRVGCGERESLNGLSFLCWAGRNEQVFSCRVMNERIT